MYAILAGVLNQLLFMRIIKKILAGLAVIVIVFSVSYTLVRNYQINKAISASAFAAVEPLVRVVDQQPFSDGVIIENRVYISEVTLKWPGFVAVYENPYDKFGTLVGTSRFLPAGKRMYVPVDLVKEYQPGQRLYAILHRDTGDTIYNLVQDSTVKDKNGLEIMDSFTTRIGGFGHGR